MLIGAGASLDVHDYAGGTPLLNAIHYQRDENIKILLKAGANVDIADNKGETPLMVSAQIGRLDYVETLLAKHALTGTRNPEGNTALYYAIFEGYDEIAMRLLHARTTVQGLNNGYTLLHWAQVMGRIDIVPLLVKAGAVN
jgi:ankyrin repeat protein